MYFLAECSLSKNGFLGKFQISNHSMNSLSLYILILHLSLFRVKAQSFQNQRDLSSQDDQHVNFQPSLGVVIGILFIVLLLAFIILLYAKFCRTISSNSVHNNLQILDGLPRSRSRFSGLDKTVIESLPFFRFSSLKGSREGLECAICLSKFEDIEILRLLPKCKHAFHINCLDEWLEKHSSCPLCRHKISADDLSTLTYSNSLRFLWDQSEVREESNLELHVQREEIHLGSSRFSVGSSFRKTENGKKDEERLPIQLSDDSENNEKILHKFNHKIIVSDVVLMKNRWSNVSSSDLMFLNSEMLNHRSSNRFSALEANITAKSTPTREVGDGEIMNIKEEMDRKREFEIKISKIQQNDSFRTLSSFAKASESKGDAIINAANVLNPSEKRSMSEITVHPRFKDFDVSIEKRAENSIKEDKMRRIWLPIARRTVQWFANREGRTSQPQNSRQSLNF